MADDAPRFLARIGGYCETSARAVDGLECVSSEVQQAISQRARLDEVRRTRAAWAKAEGLVEVAIGEFGLTADPRLGRSLRGVEKAVRRVARAVEALEPIDE